MVRHFFKLSEGKIFLVLSTLIASSISPFFDSRNIIFYIVAYYFLACLIVWGSEKALEKKKPGSIKSTLETMKIMSLVGGAISITFGFIILDFTFIPFLETGSIHIIDIVSGYLLIFLGIGLVALSKSFQGLEKSLVVKLFSHKKVQMNAEVPINLISALILAVTKSLYSYKVLSLTSLHIYIMLLLIITGSFVWFIFRLFK
ncbi:MAG: hypothetical protein KKC05_03485 [Nanoarchaeota archaeon]|nr:hypothetical protein [Nanoarchaeota archaeon]